MMKAEDPTASNPANEFESLHGPMNKGWSLMAERAPDFFSAFVKISSAPLKTGALSPKMREFVRIAMAASTTHLFAPALQTHIRRAKALGASIDEVLEIIQLASMLGVHCMMLGLPTLIEVMRQMEIGMPDNAGIPAARQEALKAEWMKQRGFWHPLLDDMQRMTPDFFEALIDYSVAPVKSGFLDPKLRELIYIAIDSSTTHLHAEGTRIHIANALRCGASPIEILEVLSIVSTQGADTISLGATIVADVFAAG